MIVIKEPHALKVSFVTVMLKARHHCVSWGNCVAVFVCVPGLFCFHQWVSLSLLVVVLGVYFCWSLTLCPRHTHTQMHTHMGTYTVHTHTQVHTHTHMGTHTGAHSGMGTHSFLPASLPWCFHLTFSPSLPLSFSSHYLFFFCKCLLSMFY